MIEITELRVGNLLIYEACAYEVMGINVIETPKLNVKAVNHEWGVETCGINEIEGMPITPDWLKKNNFSVLNGNFPELWIKHLGGYRYIRYHSGVKYLDFETVNSFQRVPWSLIFVHQMQNACNDYNAKLNFIP